MGYTAINHLSKSQGLLRDLFIVLAASLLLGLSAWISIRLPFTPVPISFTVQCVLFLSVFLGRKGAYATCAYLLQGAMGLPVFANGGSGITWILGPTGGYLIGFVIASFVVSALSERVKEKNQTKIFMIMLLGNALVYAFGLPHLALFIGTSKALSLGLYPFVGFCFLKLILAHKALKGL